MITKFIEKLPYHDEKLDKVYFKCSRKNKTALHNMLFDVVSVARYTKGACTRRITYMVLFGKRYLLSYYNEYRSITKEHRTFFTYTVKKTGDSMDIDKQNTVHSRIRIGIKNSDYGIIGYAIDKKTKLEYELYEDTADEFLEIGTLIYNKKKKTKLVIPLIPEGYNNKNIVIKHTTYNRSMKELYSEYYTIDCNKKEKIKYNKIDCCFETKLMLSYDSIVKIEEKNILMLLKYL